jgi:hypothetical protein
MFVPDLEYLNICSNTKRTINNKPQTTNIFYMKKLLFLNLFFYFLLLNFEFVNAQVPSYVPTNGLVAYYPFNGNANDQSGNGNNGVVHGANLTNDRTGTNNQAYSFNGRNNYISIPFSNSIAVQNEITVSVWLYMEGGS